MNELYYLVYVYRGELKVVECTRHPDNRRIFRPTDPKRKYKYYTQIPDKPKMFQSGKIWCVDKEDISFCIQEVKKHYNNYCKNRVAEANRIESYNENLLNGEYV